MPIYKGKGDARSCGSYRSVKLLEHDMKIVEKIFEKQLRNVTKIAEMQLGSCLEKKPLMQSLY